jgi:hypothetical protein
MLRYCKFFSPLDMLISYNSTAAAATTTTTTTTTTT